MHAEDKEELFTGAAEKLSELIVAKCKVRDEVIAEMRKVDGQQTKPVSRPLPLLTTLHNRNLAARLKHLQEIRDRVDAKVTHLIVLQKQMAEGDYVEYLAFVEQSIKDFDERRERWYVIEFWRRQRLLALRLLNEDEGAIVESDIRVAKVEN